MLHLYHTDLISMILLFSSVGDRREVALPERIHSTIFQALQTIQLARTKRRFLLSSQYRRHPESASGNVRFGVPRGSVAGDARRWALRLIANGFLTTTERKNSAGVGSPKHNALRYFVLVSVRCRFSQPGFRPFTCSAGSRLRTPCHAAA